jgi:hypothetical protein
VVTEQSASKPVKAEFPFGEIGFSAEQLAAAVQE